MKEGKLFDEMAVGITGLATKVRGCGRSHAARLLTLIWSVAVIQWRVGDLDQRSRVRESLVLFLCLNSLFFFFFFCWHCDYGGEYDDLELTCNQVYANESVIMDACIKDPMKSRLQLCVLVKF